MIGRPASFDKGQLHEILNSIGSLAAKPGLHWHETVPVFLSSLGGLAVGISLDLIRRLLEKRKAEKERRDKEFHEIKAALVVLAHNIEMLLIVVVQSILPHYNQSEAAYAESKIALSDPVGAEIFSRALFSGFPAVIMISPLPYFIEYDYLEKLPFLLAKQPYLVIDSAKQIHFARQLTVKIGERNQSISAATAAIFQTGTASLTQIQMIIQLQQSVGMAECVNAIELFDTFDRVASGLETAAASYKTNGNTPKLVTPSAMEEYLVRLRAIREAAIAAMPLETGVA